jgi:hypothetical protein
MGGARARLEEKHGRSPWYGGVAVGAETNKTQKRTIDDAKLLFLHHRASAATAVALSLPEPNTPPPAAIALEYEVQARCGALKAWLLA